MSSNDGSDIDYTQDKQLRALLTAEQIEDFKSVFEMFDLDNGGSISVDELKSVMFTLGQNPTDEEIKQMMEEADDDKSGEIDFKEFAILMAARLNDKEQHEELEEVFNLFDKNGDEIIDYRDLKEIFVELGTEIELKDCKLLIELHDDNGDGLLQFTEFVSFMMAK